MLSDAESQNWDAHKIQCPAEYSEYANIHLESAVANNNEVLHSILIDVLPRRDRHGMKSVRLGAALAIIRYNDGYNSVFNIFKSFQPNNPFIRTKE